MSPLHTYMFSTVCPLGPLGVHRHQPRICNGSGPPTKLSGWVSAFFRKGGWECFTLFALQNRRKDWKAASSRSCSDPSPKKVMSSSNNILGKPESIKYHNFMVCINFPLVVHGFIVSKNQKMMCSTYYTMFLTIWNHYQPNHNLNH